MHLAALEIPAQPEFVSVARLVVSTVAGDRYDLSDDQLESLKLAVSEACVMAIESGVDSGNSHVMLDCNGTDERIEVTVGREGTDITQDAVTKHSPVVIEGHDFDEEFGLPMIGSLVDEVSVEKRPQGNRLHMTLFSTLAEEI